MDANSTNVFVEGEAFAMFVAREIEIWRPLAEG